MKFISRNGRVGWTRKVDVLDVIEAAFSRGADHLNKRSVLNEYPGVN